MLPVTHELSTAITAGLEQLPASSIVASYIVLPVTYQLSTAITAGLEQLPASSIVASYSVTCDL